MFTLTHRNTQPVACPLWGQTRKERGHLAALPFALSHGYQYSIILISYYAGDFTYSLYL